MDTVPAWVQDAIFYQIFPERFDNGDPTNDPVGVQPWGGSPKPNSFFGGDLQGIINRIGYLKDLGVNALYLNPIFAADSHHKYNAKDYLTIDPAFGTNDLFDKLIAVCHAHNMRIVIDGVFNHVGTAHFAFRDVKEKGRESAYASWFNIYSFPVSEPKHPNYECWWGHGSLPKLMVQNPAVKKHIFDVTKFWTEKGIDGWRLDVPNELPHEFWKEWRAVVRSINPECYIVGELWQDASPWLQGDEFDATMNYRFRQACIDFFVEERKTPGMFLQELQSISSSYSPAANYAMQNLLGSHDTERYLTLCHGDAKKVALSVIFQYTYIGAPMTYYGDEIGMEGGKDPDCRRCMIWDEKKWNTELFDLHKTLIRIRNSSAALRRGEFIPVSAEAKGKLVAFRRSYENEHVYVVLNREKNSLQAEVEIPAHQKTITDALSGDVFAVAQGKSIMKVHPRSARIFIVRS